MTRKLIIEGNAVYEIDEDCMLKRRLDRKEENRDCNAGKEKRNERKKEK